MDTNDKPLAWLHGEIKTPPFSAEARLEAGGLLRALQKGETRHAAFPTYALHWQAMPRTPDRRPGCGLANRLSN